MAKITNAPSATLTLDLERKKSFSFRLNVRNADRGPVDLTGSRIRFVLKPDPFDDDHYDVTNLVVNQDGSIPPNEGAKGYCVFGFQAAELDQPPGEYYGSIVMWTATGFSVTLLKLVVNILENTESDSIHISYVPSAPPSEIEVVLRGNQVVNVTTQNLGVGAVQRGPCIRTTEEQIDPVLGATTQLAISQVVAQAYPTGGLVELRPGDLVFQAGLLGKSVAGRVFSVGDTNFQMTTVISTDEAPSIYELIPGLIDDARNSLEESLSSTIETTLETQVGPLVNEALGNDPEIRAGVLDLIGDAAVQDEAFRESFNVRDFWGASLVANGNFSAGKAGWGAQGGSIVVTNGVAVVTGNGTTSGIGEYSAPTNRFIAHEGHVIYVGVNVSTPDAGATSISVMLSNWATNAYLDGEVNAVVNPTAGREYALFGLVRIPPALDGVEVNTHARVYWASGAAASGKRAHTSNFVVIDLTAAYGAGNEPPAATVAYILRTEHAGFVGNSRARLSTSVGARLEVRERRVPAQRLLIAPGGPMAMIRFDDGYRSTLTIAAQILAQVGGRGFLATGTHPTEWLGTIQNGLEILSVRELRALHFDFLWEIASHTRNHVATNQASLADWHSNVKASISDLVSYGLPVPGTFAYPNGTRTATHDRIIYKLFNNVGITGGPERLPLSAYGPTFFHGWCTTNSSPSDKRIADIAAAKRYADSQISRGYHAILGFHGITPGNTPPALPFHLDEEAFTEIIAHIVDRGYRFGTPQELRNKNLLADPNFSRFPIARQEDKSFPWQVNSLDGWRRATSAGLSVGTHRVTLDTGATVLGNGDFKAIEQRIAVEPSTEYRIRVDAFLPTSSYVQGGCRVDVWFLDQLGEQLAGGAEGAVSIGIPGANIASYAGGFTTPAGAYGARVQIRSNPANQSGFRGVCHLGHVTVEPANSYDVLA